MVLPALILQKPHAKSKTREHVLSMKRRLQLWKIVDGEGFDDLFTEVEAIQKKLKSRPRKQQVFNAEKTFANLIMQGKISAAMKVLDKDFENGVLQLSPEVINELQTKHPIANPVKYGSILLGPKLQVPSSYFNDIDEHLIQKAALLTKGSAGPSGLDADVCCRILCSRNFSYDGLLLREEIAMFVRNMLSKSYDPIVLQPLISCRLIPLNKNPGVRPIGVDEVLRRIMGKAVTWACKNEIKEAAGPLQTCAGFKAGAEAAIHAMHSFFDQEGTDAVLLIDAENAFNSMNRKTALVNVQVGCPFIAKYLINTYRKAATLILSSGEIILSSEGTTQGDPLAMPWYSINSSIMITNLHESIPNVKQSWLADDASAAGSIAYLKQWFDSLNVVGKSHGYHINASKTWLIVKNEEAREYARSVFNNEINITLAGQRHLGAVIGSTDFKDEYCNALVSK